VIRLDAARIEAGGLDWYEMKISDTGIGMSKEQLENVFEAFYQAEDSPTRKYQGTGLGLTISKKFCDLLGGNVTVSSQPNKGTTFTVRFPLQFPTPL
jgi:signal transduction histidine kinase